ncbi:hypothetical protein [Achromobacter insolitus]|uniref:hypothetical protein n=1 Tax=Achromobacter insolitus TaxID=217204 RepID=UPI0007C39462|nr:hypothetical protein [Achromobacter insolitus]OAD17132.1 hypothetical protein A3839_24325 [Achromobacter insolitus]
MAEQIQQVTPINLPNPRTPLIVVDNGIGYPTREFMALLRQFTVRVGGTGGDVDIINPDADLLAPVAIEAPQDAAIATESLLLVSGSQLQEMVAAAVAAEMQMAIAQLTAPDPLFPEVLAPAKRPDPLAIEMTMGQGFEPV